MKLLVCGLDLSGPGPCLVADFGMDSVKIRCELNSCGSGQCSVGCCEDGNKPLSSIKGGEFLNLPSHYQLLKKELALNCRILAPLM